MGGTFEYQPGALLEFGNNVFFNGNLDDIAKDNPEIALQRDGTLDQSKTWFNTDAGFETAAALQPAPFQKRAFPFRVDGVRGPGLFLVNTNIVRNFGIGGGRSLQFRVDVQNLFDTVLWKNPNARPDEHELRQGHGRDEQHHAVLHVRLEGELLSTKARARSHGQGRHIVPGRFLVGDDFLFVSTICNSPRPDGKNYRVSCFTTSCELLSR